VQLKNVILHSSRACTKLLQRSTHSVRSCCSRRPKEMRQSASCKPSYVLLHTSRRSSKRPGVFLYSVVLSSRCSRKREKSWAQNQNSCRHLPKRLAQTKPNLSNSAVTVTGEMSVRRELTWGRRIMQSSVVVYVRSNALGMAVCLCKIQICRCIRAPRPADVLESGGKPPRILNLGSRWR
jgi:hypothetical protein